MGFILDEDTSNVPELKSLPEAEYALRLCAAEQKNSKKGDPMISLRLDVPDEPLSDDIYHYIMLPTSNDSEKQKIRKQQNLRDFKAAFGMPASGPLDMDDYIGSMGWGILGEEENEQSGKLQNRIKKFVPRR